MEILESIRLYKNFLKVKCLESFLVFDRVERFVYRYYNI